MALERIQKIMSEQGLCSRRAAEQIIAEGRVKVNGRVASVGDKMDPDRDVLHVDDERIYIDKEQKLYYLALYKPRGYVTTASDELGRKTVMDLVADIPARLYPVGRLDKDSEGLLLMTNDGTFANAMMHPSGGISKLYRVTVQPRAEESQILKLSSGVVLDDGTKTLPTTAPRPCPAPSTWWWTSRAAPSWRSPCGRAKTVRSAGCARRWAWRWSASSGTPRAWSSWGCSSPASTGS